MKLLLDENLSPRLAGLLSDPYPGSSHVKDVGLRGAADSRIWDFARAEAFVIVSKDSDFRERSLVDGFPPKIVWLAVGNASTSVIAELLQRERPRMQTFVDDHEASLLMLSIGDAAL